MNCLLFLRHTSRNTIWDMVICFVIHHYRSKIKGSSYFFLNIIIMSQGRIIASHFVLPKTSLVVTVQKTSLFPICKKDNTKNPQGGISSGTETFIFIIYIIVSLEVCPKNGHFWQKSIFGQSRAHAHAHARVRDERQNI